MTWAALFVLLLRPASGLERCVARGAAAVWPAEAEPNGIVLPRPWPPRPGGDLFDDDFLLDASLLSGVSQKRGQAKVASHAVLVPNKRRAAPWETGMGRTARPFGDGALVDPLNSSRILMWYRCGWRGRRGQTCLAVSGDGGRHFEKPKLDKAGTNVVITSQHSQHVEAFDVAYDFLARPRRFIAQRMEYTTHGKVYGPYETYTSHDGRSWRKRPAAQQQSPMADRSTFFLNPLRSKPVWTWSLRENMQCDVDGVAYESVLLHALAILHGPYSGQPRRRQTENGTGLAVLRRDGFAGLEPAAAAPAVIVTKPLGFSRGDDVYVNVLLRSAGARLDVEVLDASTLEKLCDVRSATLRGPLDSTRHKLTISGLEKHAHERLRAHPRFRFKLHGGMLYSFWVTSSRLGSSGGFLGGGAIGRVNFAYDAGE
ncbi:hypothetical protein M885DRAFT_556543 [Pelagophyceae sp. CCMP2097]|nr:hypothetical protein M885DRAFT_556543 [Pelagophyceae sp. CCMP2097]